MGNNIVLIGGGGHCKSVLDSVLRSGIFNEIVITDELLPEGSMILGCKVIGSDECLEKLRANGFKYAFVTVGSIGDNTLRKKLADKASSLGFKFPVIIDPSADVSESATVGDGTFIGKHAVINSEVTIEEHCIINTGALVEHECKIGAFTHVSVGAILCGNVDVGQRSFIGAGSTVIQCIKIGNDVVVGANSTILKNLADNSRNFGLVKKIENTGTDHNE